MAGSPGAAHRLQHGTPQVLDDSAEGTSRLRLGFGRATKRDQGCGVHASAGGKRL